jgi:hypothetical protein
MNEQRLARVPQRIWAEGRPANARNWASEFNMASWVRLTGVGGQMELVVRHRDDAGEHVTTVDSVEAGGQESALLSGVVRLTFQGRVENVEVHLKLAGETMRYEVDELFMQRRDSSAGRDNKLISNF